MGSYYTERRLSQIDRHGVHGWRDEASRKYVRDVLIGLHFEGHLDVRELRAEMAHRGYDRRALNRLSRLARRAAKQHEPLLVPVLTGRFVGLPA